jgi:hypothetical protein
VPGGENTNGTCCAEEESESLGYYDCVTGVVRYDTVIRKTCSGNECEACPPGGGWPPPPACYPCALGLDDSENPPDGASD